MEGKPCSFRLIIHGPGGFSAEFEPSLGITTVGRDADNEIQLDDRTISRHHARLECISTGCDIIDLDSSNGTFVNGAKIPPKTPVPLSHMDKIGLGPYFELVYMAIELEPVIPPEAAPLLVQSPVEVVTTSPPAPPPPEDILPLPEPSPDGSGETFPPGLSQHSRRLIKYLPGIYHTGFMAQFLGIFESILVPIEWTIDHFDLFLSPRTAPAGFLPWLANWYEAEFDKTWSEEQQREFLEHAYAIYARRGTKWALSRVLEIYTGCPPLIDDTSEDLKPHSFWVVLPVSEKSTNRATVEGLIHFFKPAHTDYELRFEP